MADPLDRLPARARARLEQFSQALERIPVDGLRAEVLGRWDDLVR